MELIADIKCLNQDLMRSEEIMHRWLLEMCDVIGMTPFGEPTVVDYPFPQKDDTALSATLFIGESSIVIHTYPEFNHSFINIFSCMEFDLGIAMDFIRKTFQVIDEQFIVLERGIDLETGAPIPLCLRLTKRVDRDAMPRPHT